MTRTLLMILAAALLTMPHGAAAEQNCKPNRATCANNHQCCSGFCGSDRMCAAPPPTTTTITTTTTTSTTAPTTTTTTTTSTTTTTTTPRFVDNGDGTVTDDLTGLQWEKKDNTCPGVHCVDVGYMWCVDANPVDGGCDNGNVPDGTAFTSFLNTLNGGATGVGNCVSGDGSSQTGGFANHCDWRLPTIAELRTILDTSQGGCGGGSGACIDPTFGPTGLAFYFSSTTSASQPGFAWGVNFGNGLVPVGNKALMLRVRAVRGGCACTGGKVLDPSGMCVCPSGQTEDGSGTCQCPVGQGKCNGTCTDLTTNSNCGACGNTCTGFDTCGGGGVANQCGCTPVDTCGPTQCGSIPDGCGGEIPCDCN